MTVKWVEVKASKRGARKGGFELSLRELLFAAECGAAFEVWRVACGGEAAARVTQRIADPVAAWRRGELQLSGTVHATQLAVGPGGDH